MTAIAPKAMIDEPAIGTGRNFSTGVSKDIDTIAIWQVTTWMYWCLIKIHH